MSEACESSFATQSLRLLAAGEITSSVFALIK